MANTCVRRRGSDCTSSPGPCVSRRRPKVSPASCPSAHCLTRGGTRHRATAATFCTRHCGRELVPGSSCAARSSERHGLRTGVTWSAYSHGSQVVPPHRSKSAHSTRRSPMLDSGNSNGKWIYVWVRGALPPTCCTVAPCSSWSSTASATARRRSPWTGTVLGIRIFSLRAT